jgi:hypothetical protein
VFDWLQLSRVSALSVFPMSASAFNLKSYRDRALYPYFNLPPTPNANIEKVFHGFPQTLFRRMAEYINFQMSEKVWPQRAKWSSA